MKKSFERPCSIDVLKPHHWLLVSNMQLRKCCQTTNGSQTLYGSLRQFQSFNMVTYSPYLDENTFLFVFICKITLNDLICFTINYNY